MTQIIYTTMNRIITNTRGSWRANVISFVLEEQRKKKKEKEAWNKVIDLGIIK